MLFSRWSEACFWDFFWFVFFSGSHGCQAVQAGSCSRKSICKHFQSLWMILGSHEAASGFLHVEVSSSQRNQWTSGSTTSCHRHPRMTLSVLCVSSRRCSVFSLVKISSPSFISRHFPSISIRRCYCEGFYSRFGKGKIWWMQSIWRAE